MSRFAVPAAVIVCLALTAPVVWAQNASEGTTEEKDACYRDATRFCKDELSDTFKVLTCLQNNRTKLREPCRAVLRSHGVLEPPSKNTEDAPGAR